MNSIQANAGVKTETAEKSLPAQLLAIHYSFAIRLQEKAVAALVVEH